MITASRPNTQPLFAGKQKKSANPIKAGLIGLLLGSAGGAAAVNGSSQLNKIPDTLDCSPAQRFLKTPQTSDKWEALISPQTLKTDNTKRNRKLLQAAAPAPLPAETLNDQIAREILQEPPFFPNNANLFSSNYYPETSPMIPATLVPQTDEDFKASLEEFFNKRFPGEPQKIQEGLAVFDDPILKAKIPASRLRAAVALLKGTASEGAIDYFKSDAFGEMKFQLKNDPEKDIADMVQPLGQEKFELWINPRYYGEDFRLFPMFIAFEAAHQDIDSGDQPKAEPLVAFATASLEYLKLLALTPELAQPNTKLTRIANTLALHRLNTRDEQGNLRLFTDVDNTTPGSSGTHFQSAGDYFDIASPDEAYPTLGNAYLKSVLKATTGRDIESPNYDAGTLKLLDETQNYLSPSELVKAGKALMLNITDDEEVGNGSEAPAPAPSIAPGSRKLLQRLMTWA